MDKLFVRSPLAEVNLGDGGLRQDFTEAMSPKIAILFRKGNIEIYMLADPSTVNLINKVHI